MISRLEKVLLNLAALLTAATGLVYAWMKYLVRPSDPYSVVNHPWQPGLLSGHVLVSPLLLFGFGLIAREHILGRYRDPRSRAGRRTGILTALALVPMVFSGYLLQVLTSEGSRRMAGVLHLAAGVFFLGAYAFHLVLAGMSSRSGQNQGARIRRTRRRKEGTGKSERRTGSSPVLTREPILKGLGRRPTGGKWRGAGPFSAGS